MSTTGQTMELLGKTYPFKFGMKFQRLFMEHYNIDKLTDYQKKISLLENIDGLKALDVLATFVISAVHAAQTKPTPFDKDELLEYLANNGDVVATAMQNYIKAQPSPVGKSNKARSPKK